MKTFLITAHSLDGRAWDLSFECETWEQAEEMIESLGLMVKPTGYGIEELH